MAAMADLEAVGQGAAPGATAAPPGAGSALPGGGQLPPEFGPKVETGVETPQPPAAAEEPQQ